MRKKASIINSQELCPITRMFIVLLVCTNTGALFPFFWIKAVKFLYILQVLLARYCNLFQTHVIRTFKQLFSSLPAYGSKVHLPLLSDVLESHVPHWNVSKRQGNSQRQLQIVRMRCDMMKECRDCIIVFPRPQQVSTSLLPKCSYRNSKALVLNVKLFVCFFHHTDQFKKVELRLKNVRGNFYLLFFAHNYFLLSVNFNFFLKLWVCVCVHLVLVVAAVVFVFCF